MMRPNWFDHSYESALASANAKQALELVAKDERLVKAVTAALADHDANAGRQGWAGPSRTQAVRSAICDLLSADE